jgi:hypothetical protein
MKPTTKKQREILAQIRALRRAKKPLNISAVKRDHPRLLVQVMSLKHFRGWRKALEAAQVSYDEIRVEYRDYCVCAECGRELKTLNAHLRAAHQMTVPEYRKLYPGHETTSDEMRANSTWALVRPLHWEKIWSREYLIDYLIHKYEQGQSLSPWKIYRDEPSVHAIAKAYFGSYRAAIEAAGLDYRRVREIDLTEKWTHEKVLQRIRQLHAEQPLTCVADIRRRDTRLYDRCNHYFGGAVAAVEAAGIPYALLQRRRSRKWNKGLVVRTLRILKTDGRPLRLASLKSRLNGQTEELVAAAEKCFGSWDSAVAAAESTRVRAPR